MTAPNQPKIAQISLGSLDENLHVEAQYNPKELTVDKAIPWSQHTKGNTDGLQWEFTGAAGRTTSIDLLFDGADQNKSVTPQIKILQQLAAVRDPGSTDPEKRRPHHCVAVWGDVLLDFRLGQRFQCVITQLTVKYSMFSPAGDPVRATVTVKLQEATRVSMAKSDSGGGNAGGGNTGTTGGANG